VRAQDGKAYVVGAIFSRTYLGASVSSFRRLAEARVQVE